MGCDGVLDEVDTFINKFAKLKENKRRLIEMFKFITKDTEGLKAKLTHNTSLLLTELGIADKSAFVDNCQLYNLPPGMDRPVFRYCPEYQHYQPTPGLRSASSFSIMAREAGRCEAKISQFQERWMPIFPKSLQHFYLEPLTVVCRHAVEFTIFENKETRLLLSDLGAFTACGLLIGKSGLLKECASNFETRCNKLLNMRGICHPLLGYVQDFMHSLDAFARAGIEPSAHSFPVFRAE
ncbi:hypothetical protein K504DRAFT_506602 [Pleomassaria siparia CBS 279.74]|uniref:Uncharacterized protein n=1 Tax=Pleomassaria siparia CBS 279.74 TaxID=1314801 RepID=A0A6G1JXZ6_9PLEO|nr:hypothetical protein K504DRAFT_506602 [Pleomassaria siparia CBS 279.74]